LAAERAVDRVLPPPDRVEYGDGDGLVIDEDGKPAKGDSRAEPAGGTGQRGQAAAAFFVEADQQRGTPGAVAARQGPLDYLAGDGAVLGLLTGQDVEGRAGLAGHPAGGDQHVDGELGADALAGFQGPLDLGPHARVAQAEGAHVRIPEPGP